MIEVEGLSKIYRVAEKQPGLAGTLRHSVRRRTRDVVAVQDLSFQIEQGEMGGFLRVTGELQDLLPIECLADLS